jgi:Domain of unknown function (DUF4375)
MISIKALHLTGPAFWFSETSRFLQPARQVNAVVSPLGGIAVDHAGVMNSCDAKGQRVSLSRLTAAERVVVLVSRANFEVELGGLDAFYYNSAGDEAVPTVAALEAVGATQAASTLREANALFPSGSPPRDREKRFAGLEVVRKLPNSPLASLEKEVGRDEPDVFSRLCSFIEAHAKELQEHGGGG